ncbi:hypothetical protein [uncultured Tateyamaria sp.]|uniref:hypothetical protein n=1 Tax=uncultured Tateyamaria sp. TaxID=455651 RepID=UPI002623D03C|nr:hypothetical protein [uncultured Tateyamaria sp.]
MAQITRLALFWRAFFLSLIFGSTAASADETENRLWQNTVSQNTPSAYFNYLSSYPAGVFVEQAVNALVNLGCVNERGIDISCREALGTDRSIGNESVDNGGQRAQSGGGGLY